MRKAIITIALVFVFLASNGLAEFCDPALAPNCGSRGEGVRCKNPKNGKLEGVWSFVTSFPASIDLCTGYTSDCGDGPCNAFETWTYTWEVWECVKGDQVLKRTGCIRAVLSRTPAGKCCDGTATTEPIKSIVHDVKAKAGKTGCGCQTMPQEMCKRCHAGGMNPRKQAVMIRPLACTQCHEGR